MRLRPILLAAPWVCGFAILALLSFPAAAPAQGPALPKNVIQLADGKLRPAPGYTWLTGEDRDFRVRWVPGLRHPIYANVVAAPQANEWRAAPGYRWLTRTPNDFRVVKAGPSDEDIAKAVLKAIGALILHDKSKPQPNDNFGDALGRALAREARDALLDSALEDLVPQSTAVERAAVRNLAILALDGRLARNRDRVLAQLRRTNPDMADAAEVVEFLIRLAQASDRARQ